MPASLVMEGKIEPVRWQCAIKLAPADSGDFLDLKANAKAAKFLAEKPGILLPFIWGMVAMIPRLVFRMRFFGKHAPRTTECSIMHFRSEGLGDRELVMGLGGAHLQRHKPLRRKTTHLPQRIGVRTLFQIFRPVTT